MWWWLLRVYSVVTDLARFRGKSTSTPFMMARSVCELHPRRTLLDSRYDKSCRGMTLMRPCRQSTVRGTRITLADCGTESSSSLQMITEVSLAHNR